MAERVIEPGIDTPAIDQVGMVVRDLEDGMDRFGLMLGIPEWEVFEFSPPDLSNVTYRGEERSMRWRICLATVGEMDIELIEPIEGENTYTAHLNEHGEGLHHIACFSFEHPEQTVEQLVDSGVSILQSGDFRGGTFWYFDTRDHMNGVIFEIVDLGPSPPEPDRVYKPLEGG